MKSQVFAIRDSKVEAYLQPFFSATKGSAIRALQEACSDKNSHFAKYPGDFTLFHVGEYDDVTGRIVPLESNVCIGTPLELCGGDNAHN